MTLFTVELNLWTKAMPSSTYLTTRLKVIDKVELTDFCLHNEPFRHHLKNRGKGKVSKTI
jgi:hypothetical protein